MRRAVVGLVASVMASGSVLGASPAQAGPGDPVGCLPSNPGTPTTSTVAINGLDVTINPSGAPGDAETLEDYVGWVFNRALDYVFCVEGDVADPVGCLTWRPLAWVTGQHDPEYVTQNPDGSVTVHGNEIAADAEGCL
jgi:hypothetical protein